jgi:hypothetical protein
MVMETGDETYKSRLERYEYIVARRAEKPRPTLEAIGTELGISRQNVWRLLSRGGVKPSGRPRSNEGRRAKLVERLGKWQAQRLRHLAANKPTDREDGWIATIEADLKELG